MKSITKESVYEQALRALLQARAPGMAPPAARPCLSHPAGSCRGKGEWFIGSEAGNVYGPCCWEHVAIVMQGCANGDLTQLLRIAGEPTETEWRRMAEEQAARVESADPMLAAQFREMFKDGTPARAGR